MATQYTPILQLALPVTGELNGTWGDVVNDNITSMVEEAIAGLATISTWTTNAHTLTTADGTTDEARCAMLVLQTGAGGTALSGAGQVICPALTKLYVVKNDAAYAVTVKTSGGSGVAIAAGDTAFVFCDGTNVNACVTQIINGHITGNLTVDGNTTLGDATSDTITATARFASDVNPSADNTYDLGTSGNSWRNLYIDGTATIATLNVTTIDTTNLEVTNIKAKDGTASITLADSTGVATLSANPILNAGTANGVAYLNGSKVLTTGSALTFDGASLNAANGNIISRGVGTLFGTVADGSVNLYSASGPAIFWASGSEQMRLTSTGLGIGTSSPLGLLTLNKGSASDAVLNVKNTVSQFNIAQSSDGNAYLYQTGAYGIKFGTNNNQQLELDSSGNLGLGVTPSADARAASLQVGGGGTFRSENYNGSTNNQIKVIGNGYEETGTGYKYLASAYASMYNQINGVHGWYTAPSGTAGNAISFTQAMTLDASGNLGIGTSSPTVASGYTSLCVNNATNGGFIDLMKNGTVYARTEIDGSNNATIGTGSGTTTSLRFQTNNTERMRIDSSGNVGIGTSSPGMRLDVAATQSVVGLRSTGAFNSSLNFYSSSSTLEAGLVSVAGGGALLFTTGSSGTERMRIDSSGNVGIGTSSPDARLVATTSSGDCQIIARANGTNGGGIFVADGGGAGSYPGLALKQSGVHYWSVQQRADTNLYLHRESGSGNTIVDSGALLVGTTTSFARIVSKISSNAQIAVWTSGLSGDLTTAGIRVDKFDNNSTTSQKFIEFSVNNNTTANGQINANGASQAAFGNWSDVRLKENIKDLSGQLEKICSLRPVEFDYKSGGHQIGFIAQEIQNVFPDSVSDDGTEQKYLSVTGWNKTEARLVKAIQELKAELDATKAEVAALKDN